MADEQVLSAIDSPAGRLVGRLTNLSEVRPDEPRNFRGEYPGWLLWTPPQILNFTHYRLRVDQDDEDPNYEISSGATSLQIFKGRRFQLSTYNATNGLESGKVDLEYDTEADLVLYINESLAEEEVQVNYTMDAASYAIPLAPYPQVGLNLTVFLAQDATGSRVPSWDASFINAPTTGLDGTADTLTVVQFVYRRIAGSTSGADAWYCVGYLTGLTTL